MEEHKYLIDITDLQRYHQPVKEMKEKLSELERKKQNLITNDTRLDVGTIVPLNILLSELSQIEFCDGSSLWDIISQLDIKKQNQITNDTNLNVGRINTKGIFSNKIETFSSDLILCDLSSNLGDILTKLRCDFVVKDSFPASDFTISYEDVEQKTIPVIRIKNDRFVPMADFCDLNTRVRKLQELVSPLRVKVYDSTWKQLLSNNYHYIEYGYYLRGLVGTDRIAMQIPYGGIEVSTLDSWSMSSDYFERVDDNTYRYAGNNYIPWIKDANGDWLFVMSDTCYS